MIKRLFLILLFPLLLSCEGDKWYPGPSEEPEKDSYDVRFKFHKEEDIPLICDHPYAGGCFQPDSDPCEIYVKPNDWCSIIHELQHCFHGLWHGDEPTGNGRCE